MFKKVSMAVLVLTVILLFVGLMPVHGEEEIYRNVVRLHVIANSDSEEDQELKLKVRDAILEVTVPLLQNCTSRAEAETLLRSHEEEIRRAAETVVREYGKDDPVTLLFGEEAYPERSYDALCFPAGTYLSLRVCIGNAEGHNWWCCLFPPLCRGAATVSSESAEDSFISVGLTPSQYKIITENDNTVYKIRFKFLELFRR